MTEWTTLSNLQEAQDRIATLEATLRKVVEELAAWNDWDPNPDTDMDALLAEATTVLEG